MSSPAKNYIRALTVLQVVVTGVEARRSMSATGSCWRGRCGWSPAARAVTNGNSGRKTHPVGRKLANAWGLYDMLGNVWEWVDDRYGDYPGAVAMDPRGRGSSQARVGRGGSWDARAAACRASARGNGLPSSRTEMVGFRLLRRE